MSPSTEIGLFAPPIMAAIVFVLTWNIERTTSPTGTMSPGRRKFYGLGCALLMLIGYLMLWQNEIKAAWLAYPFWMSVAITGLAGFIVYLIATHRGAEARHSGISQHPSNCGVRPERRVATSIFAWIVIVWGIAGLLGGIVAVARKAMSR
jgi:hypothetical protein